ncbi:MAG: amino acid ABC transporter substrate-binding protein [Clostridiaceae bacterium]|nr:amino acid ABC transporter substrate-binding protein [Clostridiaceae bacterium]
MRKIAALILAAFVAATFAGCGSTTAQDTASSYKQEGSSAESADQSWKNVQKAGKLVLGLDDAFPPMGYVDPKTGELTGFDIDVAKEVCKRLDIELKLQPIEWDNKTAELNNGNVDCLWNGFSKTEEREKEFNLSIPYMKNNQVILIKTDADFAGLESLSGKIVGVQSDSSAESALNENEDFKKTLKSVVQIDDYSKAVMELQNGTIDAIAIDEIVARFYLANNPDSYKIMLEANGADCSLAVEDYVIGFRKADSALKEKIEDQLKAMASDGTLKDISTTWFGEDVTTVGK